MLFLDPTCAGQRAPCPKHLANNFFFQKRKISCFGWDIFFYFVFLPGRVTSSSNSFVLMLVNMTLSINRESSGWIWNVVSPSFCSFQFNIQALPPTTVANVFNKFVLNQQKKTFERKHFGFVLKMVKKTQWM